MSIKPSIFPRPRNKAISHKRSTVKKICTTFFSPKKKKIALKQNFDQLNYFIIKSVKMFSMVFWFVQVLGEPKTHCLASTNIHNYNKKLKRKLFNYLNKRIREYKRIIYITLLYIHTLVRCQCLRIRIIN